MTTLLGILMYEYNNYNIQRKIAIFDLIIDQLKTKKKINKKSPSRR